jgi:hypothetical protein
MTKFVLAIVASCTSVATAQVSRVVHGNTLVSDTLPAAELTVARGFRYVGGQVVNLYGNADAEQHIFVRGKSEGPVDAFCWMQFEHFLPSNSYTYDYKPVRTIDIGGLSFIYDTKAFTDYHVTTTDTGSDGMAMAALLAKHHLALPVRAARVRMFYLPTADRRTELMIIYGEALPERSSTPTSADGTKLDSAYTSAAQVLVDHVRRVLTLKQH